MNSSAQEIKQRLNIVDLVGEYVRLNKSGTHWKGLCPFHHEKTPSFMVNEEKQIYHCFGCGKGGDAIAFLMDVESLDFVGALKILAEKTGVELADFKYENSGEKSRLHEILESATKFYEKQLWEGQGKEKILPYLKKRGLSEDSARMFRLGYAPIGWDNVLNFLLGKGFTIEEINKTGLLVEKNQGQLKTNTYKQKVGYYDRFRDRIMFPIADPMGKILGYSARVAPGGDESQAKYINTPQTNIYDKSAALYGIFQAKNEIKQNNLTVLVEGNMDVVSAHQAGFGNTVAVSGTALTTKQLQTLSRYSKNLVLLFDMDSAGATALEKSAKLAWQQELNPFVAVLPNGIKDASEALEKNVEILREAINTRQDAMEYFFNLELGHNQNLSAKDKSSIAERLLDKIAALANGIERSHWSQKLAQALQVEIEKINEILDKKNAPKSWTNEIEQQTTIEERPVAKKRKNIIRDKFVGVLISRESVWESLARKYADDAYLCSDALIASLINRGEKYNWNADDLLLAVSDEKSREALRRYAFEARFQFKGNDDFTELEKDELLTLGDDYAAQYRRELQKEKLSSIIRDIRSAEQSRDKEALKLLMEEFTRLSQELK